MNVHNEIHVQIPRIMIIRHIIKSFLVLILILIQKVLQMIIGAKLFGFIDFEGDSSGCDASRYNSSFSSSQLSPEEAQRLNKNS